MNEFAVSAPETFTSPTTLSLYPFAVVPIPTPSASTQKVDVPDPTLNVQSPGESVPTPTESNIKNGVGSSSSSVEVAPVLTTPKVLQLFSKV